MKVAVYTNKGFIRKHIEIETENNNCFIVTDGMGGYKGGEKASRIITEVFFKNSQDWNISVKGTKEKVTDTLHQVSKKISDFIVDNPELSSMGAVLAGIIFCSDAMLSFNSGDCRTYAQQGEYLEKLSHDHSIVQMAYWKYYQLMKSKNVYFKNQLLKVRII